MKFQALIGGEAIPVEKIGEGRFLVGEKECAVSVEALEEGVYSLIVDGRSYEVAVREEKKGFLVEVGAHAIPVKLQDPFEAQSASGPGAVEGEVAVSSPMPGRVVGIKVEVGQAVKEGEGVALVEAMKMENELAAPKDGKVKTVLVKVGEAVEGGQDLLVIE